MGSAVKTQTRAQARTRPTISVSDALAAWFVLENGSVHCVGSCKSTYLYDLVEQVAPHWSGEQHLALMDLLDEDEDEALGRWQLIETLLTQASGLRIYDSVHAARAAAAQLHKKAGQR